MNATNGTEVQDQYTYINTNYCHSRRALLEHHENDCFWTVIHNMLIKLIPPMIQEEEKTHQQTV